MIDFENFLEISLSLVAEFYNSKIRDKKYVILDTLLYYSMVLSL